MKNKTTEIANLSETAKRLLDFLILTKGAWEHKCMEFLFTKPVYPEGDTDRAGKIAYWQWESNAYGNTVSRPIAKLEGGNFEGMEFSQKVEVCFHTQTMFAYQELRKAGLADEQNSGYNDYFFYPVK